MRVEVTEADIAAGQRECAPYCPIALALNRLAPQFGRWWVEYDTFGTGRLVAVGNGYEGDPIPLPDDAFDFVNDFDEYGPGEVRPFAFDLPLEQPA